MSTPPSEKLDQQLIDQIHQEVYTRINADGTRPVTPEVIERQKGRIREVLRDYLGEGPWPKFETGEKIIETYVLIMQARQRLAEK